MLYLFWKAKGVISSNILSFIYLKSRRPINGGQVRNSKQWRVLGIGGLPIHRPHSTKGFPNIRMACKDCEVWWKSIRGLGICCVKFKGVQCSVGGGTGPSLIV